MLLEPLLNHARSTPNAVAIADEKGETTYGQLAAAAAGMGMYLSAQTRQPRVGILLPASAGFVASFYGTLLAGKTVVPINFLLGDREVAHVIKDSGVDTIVTIPQLATRLTSQPIKIVDITALPPTPAGAIEPKLPNRAVDDLAVVMYTSGTSGLPKGAMLTFGNLHFDTIHSIEAIQLKHEHVFLGVVPLFHALGMMASMLAPIQLGAKAVYLSRFSPVAGIKAIRDHKVSIMFGVPSMYGAIANMKSATAEDFAGMFAVMSGGEPLSTSLRETFKQKFGPTILEGYGLTETSPCIAFNTPAANKPGSVGRPVPGAEFRFTDDNGQPVPQGQTGEIWVKGPMVMKGYFNLPDVTANVLTPDGYFKTGDLGKIDDDGYIFITGRKKDMIIVAGEKVFPREVEEILMKVPTVQEAACVGKKDEGRGEVVVAFVQPKPDQTVTEQQLKEACKEAGLPNWKTPREYHIVADLPRSPTGKVLKRELSAKVNS
jgi:long-chain acyl-CoA synthetase